jgi:hypothetical protein
MFLTPRFEIELLVDRQQSTLQVSGTSTVDVGDMGIGNYHGLLSYNFGSRSMLLRPYAFAGAGVTTYGSLRFTGRDGTAREIDPSTRLSSTWGGGVKIYRGMFGARIEARMTPSYIRSDRVGWVCDDYWGCYVEEESQFSFQYQLSGGLTVRF